MKTYTSHRTSHLSTSSQELSGRHPRDKMAAILRTESPRRIIVSGQSRVGRRWSQVYRCVMYTIVIFGLGTLTRRDIQRCNIVTALSHVH